MCVCVMCARNELWSCAVQRLLAQFTVSLHETVFHAGTLYVFEQHVCFTGYGDRAYCVSVDASCAGCCTCR
jgi:hypothetical protein